ncbi:MAG: hypothetical protein AABX00_06945 [Nanoarchaeota archaeon]
MSGIPIAEVSRILGSEPVQASKPGNIAVVVLNDTNMAVATFVAGYVGSAGDKDSGYVVSLPGYVNTKNLNGMHSSSSHSTSVFTPTFYTDKVIGELARVICYEQNGVDPRTMGIPHIEGVEPEIIDPAKVPWGFLTHQPI